MRPGNPEALQQPYDPARVESRWYSFWEERGVFRPEGNADPAHPTKDPVPYTGVQFVAIPEFQGIGTIVGQAVAGALTGQQTVDQALAQSNASIKATMTKAGYIK